MSYTTTDTPRRYPTISQYAEAMLNPEGRFRTLACRAIREPNGDLRYHAGRYSVTFFMEIDCKVCPVVCFTSHEGFDRYRQAECLLPNEIYVFDNDGVGHYYPLAVIHTSDSYVSHTSPDSDVVPDGGDVVSESDEFSEGLRPLFRDGLYGYENAAGTVVIEPRYHWVGDFGEGRAAVKIADLMGVIDRTGVEVIKVEFDDISWDGSRYAYVDMGGRRGVVGRMGEVIVPLEYDWVGEFSADRAVVQLNGRFGYVDAAGVILEPGIVYDDASSVGDDGTSSVVIGSVRSVVKP